MEKQIKSQAPSKKRKRKSNTKQETKESKIKKIDPQTVPTDNAKPENKVDAQKITPQVVKDGSLPENIDNKYPVLKNQELVDKFMKVPLNNNQKGRIRQAIQLQYQGTAPELLPDVINAKIQGILRSSENLTDSDLRRIRILYNMLKTALTKGRIGDGVKDKKPKRKKNKSKKEKEDKDNDNKEEKKKGPKRYVVFIGNLPLDIDVEKLKNHFVEMSEHIVDVRIPKVKEGKMSTIAYIELSNEPSYELALSKHHSMLGTKRIKVLYSTQKNSKISKAEAKSKSAKLIALQKSGKLIGSIPLAKKRSQRRLKMKKAKAKQEEN